MQECSGISIPSPSKYYIETYGCQMNISDSEIVASILKKANFSMIDSSDLADVIFLNTCSVRDNAEQKIKNRLKELSGLKKKNPEVIIGILGCMSERLKTQFLEEEKMVDLIAGPDSYRDLPRLIELAGDGNRTANVLLSKEETYADISPVRLNSNGVTAFISIMRGCNNMCSFCVVPFTRGRERSRDVSSILKESEELFSNGFREIMLLGQNVNSYQWIDIKTNNQLNFAGLLQKIAKINPQLRIRFTTAHPKDLGEDVLIVMKNNSNICPNVHLPVQSGSSRILELMNRTYSREEYLNKISIIRKTLGENCGLSTDIITGFCTETESDHKETLSLMEKINFDFAYMFIYSERPGTFAEKKLKDDVALEIKKIRLNDIISLQNRISLNNNQKDLNKTHQILVEGESKRSDEFLFGRNPQNKVVIFPKKKIIPGEYVNVFVNNCTSATLLGEVL